MQPVVTEKDIASDIESYGAHGICGLRKAVGFRCIIRTWNFEISLPQPPVVGLSDARVPFD
jgi:hypothetical protein